VGALLVEISLAMYCAQLDALAGRQWTKVLNNAGELNAEEKRVPWFGQSWHAANQKFVGGFEMPAFTENFHAMEFVEAGLFDCCGMIGRSPPCPRASNNRRLLLPGRCRPVVDNCR